MQTGLQGASEESLAAHYSAVMVGALRVFCVHTYHDMCRMYALGIDDGAEQNFKAAAKKQLMSKDSVVPKLQDIVERVMESSDGLPTFGADCHELLQQIMLDYNRAYQAALAGPEASSAYRESVML